MLLLYVLLGLLAVFSPVLLLLGLMKLLDAAVGRLERDDFKRWLNEPANRSND